MGGLIGRIDRLFAWLPYDLIALLARGLVGLVFHQSWQTKVDFATWMIKPTTLFLFANEYKLPLIAPEAAAYMATAAELVLPILLWLGLFTRLSAMALLIMVLVIQVFVYPNAYMLHGLWAIGLLMLMKFGPGNLSLDALLTRGQGQFNSSADAAR